jgi:hypothetical protein
MTGHPTPKTRRRGYPAAVVATGVLTVAALILAATGHHRGAGPAATAAIPAPPRPGSTTRGASAEPSSTAGASAKADQIIASEPALVEGDPTSASAVVASWVTPAARAGIAARFAQARTAFEGAAGGPYSFDVAVLAERTTPGRPGSVNVEAVFARGIPSYATYVTEHVGLVWDDGVWLVLSMTDTPGPALATAGQATPPAEAAAALAGFSPPPADGETGRGGNERG